MANVQRAKELAAQVSQLTFEVYKWVSDREVRNLVYERMTLVQKLMSELVVALDATELPITEVQLPTAALAPNLAPTPFGRGKHAATGE